MKRDAVTDQESCPDAQTHRTNHVKRGKATDPTGMHPFTRLSESVLPRTPRHYKAFQKSWQNRYLAENRYLSKRMCQLVNVTAAKSHGFSSYVP